MVRIIRRTCTTNEACAALEHSVAIHNSGCRPLAAYVNGCEIRALDEHAVHISHIGCIEVTNVNTCQATSSKHVAHSCHIGCTEIRHIKTRQTGTMIEHVSHVRDIVRLEIANVRNGCKSFASLEPKCSTGQCGTICK